MTKFQITILALLGLIACALFAGIGVLLLISGSRTSSTENDAEKSSSVTPLEIKTAEGEVLIVPGKAFIDGRDLEAKPVLTIMQINIWGEVPRGKIACKLEHGSEVQLLEAQNYAPESRYYFLLQSGSCEGWLSENFLSTAKQEPIGDKM
jgi:hypothetical protein